MRFVAFEFRCKECTRVTAYKLRFGQAPTTVPVCGGEFDKARRHPKTPMVRVYSAPLINVKGGYKDGYR